MKYIKALGWKNSTQYALKIENAQENKQKSEGSTKKILFSPEL